jgi:site-specific DNA recombinase
MKTYFAYVRVSTARQSTGTSLAEQRLAIERYAKERRLPITHWFEEIQTAAKSGRSVFQDVIRRLDRKQAQGLILHKIDRGARNLWDWAHLGELMDQGTEVRFAHDDLDLDTRGGRLVADLLAVIAADCIRNIREETRKGFLGRLRQGLYPLPAPIGYLDRGSGKAKVPDPIKAPLVILAFQRYATGEYILRALAAELSQRGLSTRRGGPLTPTMLSRLLRRPFYAGTCTMGEVSFPGIHQPLISPELFQRVQQVLRRRKPGRRRFQHTFRYRRCLRCLVCGYALIGELKKGHTYYRCHQCPGTCFREESLTACMEETKGDVLTLRGREIRMVQPTEPSLMAFEKFESPSGTKNEPDFADFSYQKAA